jgi:hypothetical protein
MSTFTSTKNNYNANVSANSAYDLIDLSGIVGSISVSTQNACITVYDNHNNKLVTFNPATQKILFNSTVYDFVVSNNVINYYVDTVYMNGSVKVADTNNEHFIGTDKYLETLYVSSNMKNITSSGNVDIIYLSDFKVTGSDYIIDNSTHTVSFKNSTGAILTDTITANKQTIVTGNAIGTVGNINGTDTVLWSSYYLSSNETLKTLNDGMTIIGNSGQETVQISKGMHNELIAGNVETLKFDGLYKDFAYSTSGNNLLVKDANGTVATLSTNKNTDYALLFSDGSSHTLSNKSNVLSIDSNATGTTQSATDKLNYTLSLDSFSDKYLTSSAIATDIKNALSDVGKYISAKGTLDIAVHFSNESGNVLAYYSGDGNNKLTPIPTNLQSTFSNAGYATEFELEQKTGVDYNGSVADMSITINLAHAKDMSTSGAPTVGKYDLTTILEHEILHGLGIDGFLGSSSSPADKSVFDKFVNANNPAAPVFLSGTTSVALSPSSSGNGSAYYHVANATDLMGEALGTNTVMHISNIDLAILQSIGYSLVAPVA